MKLPKCGKNERNEGAIMETFVKEEAVRPAIR